ncbi:TetR/AcrR family transcriptional regulator [Aminobacter sp. AP02]|uniref:TetR/AcrR family transcriptional regulator n=1 Tax=Aminobacter sp. AP02 TaxID=2135737 RepID=UPI000D6C295F|nr:TetR/AcrR family transcriptional regulator [Aminobacter sp. AP02]PWK72681.1 TetR family transcriptional regulator [Aminobacter sp. AP02]
MQERNLRRSNRDRTEATRGDLIAAARKLFTEKSYAETGTPEIVAAAGVTRGALYHHFADKQALFEAVVEQEANAVAEEVERAAPVALGAREALLAGTEAYLRAMQVAGRTRLLLLDGPAVLGRTGMDAVDDRHGNRTLREGLATTMRAGAMRKLPLDALTGLLAATFDRAALAVDAGAPFDDQLAVIAALIDGLMKQSPQPA